MALFQFLNGPFPKVFIIPYIISHWYFVFFIFPNATGGRMTKSLLDLHIPSLHRGNLSIRHFFAPTSLPMSLHGGKELSTIILSVTYIPPNPHPLPQLFSKSMTTTSCHYPIAATWTPLWIHSHLRQARSLWLSSFQCLYVCFSQWPKQCGLTVQISEELVLSMDKIWNIQGQTGLYIF